MARLLTRYLRSNIVQYGLLVGNRSFSIDAIGEQVCEHPIDYTKKRYGYLRKFFESTLANLGDNSISISMDSNFGVGRSKMCKDLADYIKFLYIPPPNIDKMFFNRNSIPFRRVWNECVLDDTRVPDVDEWHTDMCLGTTSRLQEAIFHTRLYQLRMAQLHLLSTGQGIMYDRCYWSDRAIANALHEYGLLSDVFMDAYEELLSMFDYEIKRPHLFIYVHKPVELCLDHIRRNGTSLEKQSRLFKDDRFLRLLEKQYLDKFLPEMEKKCLVKKYDWNTFRPDYLAQDMERMNFDDATRIKDWAVTTTEEIDEYRIMLSYNWHFDNMVERCVKMKRVPEVTAYGDESLKIKSLLKKHPEMRKINAEDESVLTQILLPFKKMFQPREVKPFY